LFKSWISTAILPRMFALMMAPKVWAKKTKNIYKSVAGLTSLPVIKRVDE
jgi:hypothetical protein